MNKCLFTGNLTKDIELKTISSAKGPQAVANFDLAVRQNKKKEDGTYGADFFRCTAWGKTAEFLSANTEKGSQIQVTTRAQNKQYTNKNGETVYTIEFFVEEAEILSWKKKADAQAEKPAAGGGNNTPFLDDYDEDWDI